MKRGFRFSRKKTTVEHFVHYVNELYPSAQDVTVEFWAAGVESVTREMEGVTVIATPPVVRWVVDGRRFRYVLTPAFNMQNLRRWKAMSMAQRADRHNEIDIIHYPGEDERVMRAIKATVGGVEAVTQFNKDWAPYCIQPDNANRHDIIFSSYPMPSGWAGLTV